MSLCQVLWRNCYSSGANVFQQYLETLAEKSRLQAELPREVILKNNQESLFLRHQQRGRNNQYRSSLASLKIVGKVRSYLIRSPNRQIFVARALPPIGAQQYPLLCKLHSKGRLTFVNKAGAYTSGVTPLALLAHLRLARKRLPGTSNLTNLLF